MVAVMAIDVWEWLPFSLIIYTAALTHLDPDLIGAAAVDGGEPLAGDAPHYLAATRPIDSTNRHFSLR